MTLSERMRGDMTLLVAIWLVLGLIYLAVRTIYVDTPGGTSLITAALGLLIFIGVLAALVILSRF